MDEESNFVTFILPGSQAHGRGIQQWNIYSAGLAIAHGRGFQQWNIYSAGLASSWTMNSPDDLPGGIQLRNGNSHRNHQLPAMESTGGMEILPEITSSQPWNPLAHGH
jgi:hypothetical protein